MFAVEFITAGNAIFTVANRNSGEHYTFRVKASEPSKQFPEVKYFVALLTGRDNTRDYTYLGMLNPDTFEVNLTRASRYGADTVPVRVVRWALAKIASGSAFPEGYEVRHEGKCGRCGRTLTVPESIETGIGPECAKKLGLAA